MNSHASARRGRTVRWMALAVATLFTAGFVTTAAEAGNNKRKRSSGDGMMRLGGPSNGNGGPMRLGANGGSNTSGFQGFSGNDSGALGTNQRVRDFYLNNPNRSNGGVP